LGWTYKKNYDIDFKEVISLGDESTNDVNLYFVRYSDIYAFEPLKEDSFFIEYILIIVVIVSISLISGCTYCYCKKCQTSTNTNYTPIVSVNTYTNNPQKNSTCHYCNGTLKVICPTCKGSGVVTKCPMCGNERNEKDQVICSKCGTGKFGTCNKCNGTRVITCICNHKLINA